MHAHDRMVVLHRLSANELAISPRILGLSEAIVLSLQAFEQALDRVRKALVRSDLRNPCRIATAGGHAEQCEQGQSGRLALVRHV